MEVAHADVVASTEAKALFCDVVKGLYLVMVDRVARQDIYIYGNCS
jgi:hypothetical protein